MLGHRGTDVQGTDGWMHGRMDVHIVHACMHAWVRRRLPGNNTLGMFVPNVYGYDGDDDGIHVTSNVYNKKPTRTRCLAMYTRYQKTVILIKGRCSAVARYSIRYGMLRCVP